MEIKNDKRMSKYREILLLIQFFQESLCEKAGDISGRYPLQRHVMIQSFSFLLHTVISSTFFHFYFNRFSVFLFIKVAKASSGFYSFFPPMKPPSQ